MSRSCYVSELLFYPVKSFKGISIEKALVDDFGISYDRRFMLINDKNEFITQRTHPKLSQLSASLVSSEYGSISSLTIFSEEIGMLVFDLEEFKNAANALSKVVIWGETVNALVLKNRLTQHLSDFLNIQVSLAYMPDSSFRQVDRGYFPKDKRVSFADGYPFLLASEASLKDLNARLNQTVQMINFRPNIVISGGISAFAEDSWSRITIGNIAFELVKPCSRCVMTTINSQGLKSEDKEPLVTLSGYRKNKFGICFGQNLVHLSQGEIRTGDTVTFE